MNSANGTQLTVEQGDPAIPARVGRWLFARRTLVPLPFVLALLLVRYGTRPWSPMVVAAGVVLTFSGELLRLWSVRHIGTISRTRSSRLGPLVSTGPFAIVRNPLYIGNIAIWVGFAFTARLVWLALVIAVLMAAEYEAIVRWEELLLESRLGDAYRNYAARVPRWIPRVTPNDAATRSGLFSWRETLHSERGTLIALAAGYGLLWVKLAIYT